MKALSQKDSAHKNSHAFLKALNKKDNAVPEAAGSSNEKMAASASRSMDNPDAISGASTPIAAAGRLFMEALDEENHAASAAATPAAATAGNGAALSDSRLIVSCTARLVRTSSYEDRYAPASERTSFDPSEGRAPDLNTLGSNLYMPGEVMRETLTFPPTMLIYSDENNPGAMALAQETILAPILACPQSSLES